jgi:hypothetical protein
MEGVLRKRDAFFFSILACVFVVWKGTNSATINNFAFFVYPNALCRGDFAPKGPLRGVKNILTH